MPLYEYECNECGKKFATKQTFGEHDRHAPVPCPHCGSKNVVRLITPVGVVTSKKS